ncbi:ATP-dependent DNA helicase DinG [Paenibacillus sp. KN14-4R]|uniref:ATP-dependent DNA helicase DinG n=1 Tax=Paenibacillus sp. KN14-4R TaxID=3445773 RepID=UPI003F9F76CB
MKFAVIDFETTGSSTDDEIIQVGLVIIDKDRIIDRYTSLVQPGCSIPSSITELTGITNEMVADAPELSDVMAEMYPKLYDCVLVGHNVSFDFGFLQRGLSKAGYFPFSGRVLDTIELLKILFPSLTSYQLSLASNTFGIEHERPHQADSDAEATAEIMLRCLERIEDLPLITIQRLHAIFEGYNSNDLGWFFSDIRAAREMQAEIDPNAQQYYRGFAMNVGDWSDQEKADRDKETLPETFEAFYEQLKTKMRDKLGFEVRQAQETMITEVHDSLEKNRHLMIEAGTGTGKSMGYLIPALYYGIKNDKKIVVSTHTINLQEQLRARDIPMLYNLFDLPFDTGVLKGRSHYLCLRKFEGRVNAADWEQAKEDSLTAAQMVVWLSDTQTGDEEELHLTGRGTFFWHSVSSDADSCLNRQCPWFRKCFYHRARNEANTADLLITNHSMLFTDLNAEHRILPGYEQLIVDESHHLEEVASRHMGKELHYLTLLNSLQWMYKDARSGHFATLRSKLGKHHGDDRAELWCQTLDRMYEHVMAVREHWDVLCDKLYEVVSTGSSDPGQNELGQYVLRIKQEELPQVWAELMPLEDNVYQELGQLIKSAEKLMNDFKDHEDEYDLQSFLTDMNGCIKDLGHCRENVRFFMHQKDKNSVYWLEAGLFAKKSSVLLNCVPTDVSKLLQENLFEKKESIVMTSATLTVDKSFQYVSEQLGFSPDVEEDVLKSVQLPSPFQYRQQALVCVPRDFPAIKGRAGEVLFTEKLVHSLAEVALATQGRMLVLFTSNRMLKQVHGELKELLKPHGIGVLGQGVDSGNRSKLTRLFQEGKANVLLGTSSFWEGVDIPGDALTCLAIVRLPFQPPSHPVVEAKCENLKKQNKNPFMKFSVPQAVIRFKQGFGRLIRTSSDKGVVIIYDTRVIDTQYGKNFLYSLPGPKIESMSTSQIVPRIQQWMGENI